MSNNTHFHLPRRRRDSATPGDGGELPAVLAELMLLREENARLKAAQHQLPTLGEVLGRARSLPRVGNTDREDVGDEATQLLIESLVTREALLELCDEIEQSMASVKARLGALTPEPGGFSAIHREGLPAVDDHAPRSA